MYPTNHHKYKYFHSTVQRAKDRRQKFQFCRLPFDVRPCNVKLNLSNNNPQKLVVNVNVNVNVYVIGHSPSGLFRTNVNKQ